MGRLAASAEIASKHGLFTRVRCYPLFAVLRAANLTTLDYLALDLEGLEMKASTGAQSELPLEGNGVLI